MKDPSRLLDEAWEHFDRKEYEAALRGFAKAADHPAQAAEAQNGRALVLQALERHGEALKAFDQALRFAPEFAEVELNKAELLVEHFANDMEALKICQRVLRRGPSPAIAADAYRVRARAFLGLGDFGSSLESAERALRSGVESASAHALIGSIRFEQGDYEDARDALERAAELDPNAADYRYQLGLVDEKLGDDEKARSAFAEATRLDPERYPEIPDVDPEEVLRIAKEILAELPQRLSEVLGPVPIVVEPFPNQELVRRERMTPQVLGLFLGAPLDRPSVFDPIPRPSQIVLFPKNIAKTCVTRKELRHEIRKTLHHEIGHFFGLDEAEVNRLGLG